MIISKFSNWRHVNVDYVKKIMLIIISLKTVTVNVYT
jgi:hypothetical protein